MFLRRRFIPFLTILSFVFSASFVSADFTSEHWKYSKNITSQTAVTAETFVSLNFDTRVYNESRPDFGDLRVINSEGGETPFGFIPDLSGEIKKHEVKITERADDPERGATVMVLDLKGDMIPTNSLLFMTTESDFSREIVLEGSDNGRSWSVLLERQIQTVPEGDPSTGGVLTLQYPQSSYRYFRFTVFQDAEKSILFHGASALGPARRLVFEYDPAFSYTLHYGNPAARLPDYVGRMSFEGLDTASFVPARLNQDVFNEAYVALEETEEEGASSSRSIVGIIFPILVGVFVAGHILFWRKKQESAV